MTQHRRAGGIDVAPMEVVAALLLAGVGGAAIWDARRIGAGWGEDGPQAGYFPMLLGIGLVLASLGNLVLAVRHRQDSHMFLAWSQARHVAAVLLPTVVYVVLIGPIGIYLASVLLILWFMRLLGDFGWLASLAVALGTMLLFFLTFELWFLVPLPKGPIEDALGF
jgi:putative tricarboxylic transport membrane protein